MGPSLTNYHPTPRNIPAEGSHLYRCGSLILAKRKIFIPAENRVPDVRPVTILLADRVTVDYRNRNVVEGVLINTMYLFRS
jgi:hypothetical protein